MYTDEDLDFAIGQGIFTGSSVEEFRSSMSSSRNSPAVDEENFRLIGGFNDIFIVIACSLLLYSSFWVLKSTTGSNSLGLFALTALSWGLSEFFVLKRKMALPAIVLLLHFVGGCFALLVSFFTSPSEASYALAAGVSTIAAYLHWLRFKVPITIAAGTAAGVILLISLIGSAFPAMKDWLLEVIFMCGLLSFAFAMFWDASDTDRTTHRSDVAFWLHLLSAPLIIHPVFSGLGVLDGNENPSSMAVVVALYILMTSISIAIDRRAFMVASLAYVLYALSSLIKAYGGVGYSFAITGVFMGSALLLLSAYWHPARGKLINTLPTSVKNYIPKIKAR